MYEDCRRVDEGKYSRVDEGKYSNSGLFMYDDCRRADEGNIQTVACLCTGTVEEQTRVIFRQVFYVASPSSICLLYTSPSPRDGLKSRIPSSA